MKLKRKLHSLTHRNKEFMEKFVFGNDRNSIYILSSGDSWEKLDLMLIVNKKINTLLSLCDSFSSHERQGKASWLQ